MVSQQSTYMCDGAVVQFDWTALEGRDSYDVFGYLLNVSVDCRARPLDCYPP
jgi:hypothetical protein